MLVCDRCESSVKVCLHDIKSQPATSDGETTYIVKDLCYKCSRELSRLIKEFSAPLPKCAS